MTSSRGEYLTFLAIVLTIIAAVGAWMVTK
jgi:hypothetical protein